MITIQALVGCQNESCAKEVSYHLDMVRLFDGKPICENCYDYGDEDGNPYWDDLPPVTLAHLRA